MIASGSKMTFENKWRKERVQERKERMNLGLIRMEAISVESRWAKNSNRAGLKFSNITEFTLLKNSVSGMELSKFPGAVQMQIGMKEDWL